MDLNIRFIYPTDNVTHTHIKILKINYDSVWVPSLDFAIYMYYKKENHILKIAEKNFVSF